MVRVLGFLLIFFSSTAFASEWQGLVVIVHLENGHDLLTLKEVQDIYSGKKLRWDDGSRITAINSGKGTPARTEFYSQVLGVSQDHVFRYQNRRKVFKTLQFSEYKEIVKIVADIPGAIGYVPVENYEPTVKKVFELK